MAELGNVFGISIFALKLCTDARGMKSLSDPVWNLKSNDYVEFHLDCPTSRAEKVNFTIGHAKNMAWTNGHRKICSVRVEISVSRSRMVVRK